jgi:hypothetical protein
LSVFEGRLSLVSALASWEHGDGCACRHQREAYSGAVNRLKSPKIAQNRIKSRVKIVKFLENRRKSLKVTLTRQLAFFMFDTFSLCTQVYQLLLLVAGKSCNPGVLQSKVMQHG